MDVDWVISMEGGARERYDAILVVSDALAPGDVAPHVSRPGRFVVACKCHRAADVISLVQFDLVVVMDDVPRAARVRLAKALAVRLASGCEVIEGVGAAWLESVTASRVGSAAGTAA